MLVSFANLLVRSSGEMVAQLPFQCKRVGKTAIAGYIARTLKTAGISPCIVTMGRGGPEEPEIVDGGALEITPEYLLRIAEPLHTGDYDEAKRALCDLLLIHAVNVGKLKRSRVFGEREAANQSIARIGSFYESNGGYLDTYFVVDALRYIEEARMELNE